MSSPSMRRFVDHNELGVPNLEDTDHIVYTLPNVEVAFSPENVLGVGTLYITTSRIIIVNPSAFTLDIDVPFVGLHAVSRSTDSYPKPCLYCQLNQDDEDEPDELFLAPDDESLLKTLFDEFCKAAENNPDPPEDGEEEGDDELIYDLNEVTLGAEQAATLAHLESVFVLPNEQFEDAEEDGMGEEDEEDNEDYNDSAIDDTLPASEEN